MRKSREEIRNVPRSGQLGTIALGTRQKLLPYDRKVIVSIVSHCLWQLIASLHFVALFEAMKKKQICNGMVKKMSP